MNIHTTSNLPFSFLAIIFTFLSLHHPPSSSAAAINGGYKDAQLLLSFKSSISNPSQLQNWSPRNNPCNFSGVSCKDSKISHIDLSNTDLSSDFASVASNLFLLPNLEAILLNNCNLTGTLSFVLPRSQCSSVLSSVDLAENQISGPITYLSSFSACPGLTSLNLSRNSLDFSSQPTSKIQLNSIQLLDLSYNRISGPNLVPWLFSNGCGELQFLSVKGNKVSGALPEPMNCPGLVHLDLSSNNFSTGFPTFSDCAFLEYLDLSANRFHGDISASVSPCKRLSFLNLTQNQFSGEFPSLPADGNLQYIYLSKNGFQGEIPAHLSDLCATMVELDVSGNGLTGTLPPSFGSCTSLQLIDLSNNNFSGELPIDTFLKLSSLRNLQVSMNYFSGVLPQSLSEMPRLETLDLSSNNLSGLIPPGLCQGLGDTLKVLYLQNNMFSGEIPAGLSNCSQLISLDLSFNYLTGTIPSSFRHLSQLRDLILWLNQLYGEIPEELMYIQSLENLILDFNDLNGTIPASLSNCTNLNWISLSNNRFSGEIPASIGSLANLAILKLANNSFSGNIPPEIGDCKSLIWLDLNTNFLDGPIPPALFKQSGKIAAAYLTGKPYGYIKNDGSKQCHGAGNLLEFGGIREEQLGRLSNRHPCNITRFYRGITEPTFNHNGSMMFLDLSYNKLEGYIPKEIGTMYYLFILILAHNDLSGEVPQELGGLKNVAILDLSYNKFSGSIPQSLTSLALLGEIDFSNNNFSGMIPESAPFDTFPRDKFANNSGLCGYPLPACGSDSNANLNKHPKSHRQASVAGSVAMGLLFSLFCIFGVVIVAVEMRKRRKKKEAALESYVEGGNSHSGPGNSTAWKLTSTREALSINLAAFEKPLRKLTFADLLEATNGFHNDTLIGSGGFGDVYRAQLKDGSTVAIKKLIHVSGQGDREFTAEMETIGKIKHRNLVPLLGYCKVGEERLLVYEYMKFGSLEDVLHDRKKIGIRLNWSARRKIAIGSARGLAFLHHNCIPHIIHRDMKSSNVLLDENLEARVSDFGMARLMSAMDTHLSVSTLAGTPGYVPPEYYQSFRCSTKGDVYSYGVVLLELLTGRQPTDSADFGDNNLVGWVKQHAKLRISDVFDPMLIKEDPSLEIELLQHLKVACACLDDRPWRRPTMIQVMAMFKEIQAGSGLDSASTMTADDGSFSTVEGGVEMTIKEDTELSKQ